jgi:hypothetical protein
MVDVTWQATAGEQTHRGRSRPRQGSPALVTFPPLMAACSSFSSQGCASKLLQASRP